MESNTLFEHSKLLWSPLNPNRTRVEALRRMINHKRGLQLSRQTNHTRRLECLLTRIPEDYQELHKYSVENYGFWLDLWEFLGIVYSVPPSKVLRQLMSLNYTCSCGMHP